MIPLLIGCVGSPSTTPIPNPTPLPTPTPEPTGDTQDTGQAPTDWQCNGIQTLPRVYVGGPDVRFVGLNDAGVFGARFVIGDLDANGAPDLLVSEQLGYTDIFGIPCPYQPGDGGAYWIADPLAGGDLLDVAIRFPAEIEGCGDTDRYGSAVAITEHDYTGDGARELVVVGPEGSWVFSGTPTGPRTKADADLFLPALSLAGAEVDVDLDGDLEFASVETVHLDGPTPTTDTLLGDVGYFGGFFDFDQDGIIEIFGRTAAASVVHIEAPFTAERIAAAEQLPTANPSYLDGDTFALRGVGGDRWSYIQVIPPSGTDPCYDPGISYVVQREDLTEPGVQDRRSYILPYQKDRPAPALEWVGDFNGDGVMDFLLDDLWDRLIVLGPIDPGPIPLDDAIRIPKEQDRLLSTSQLNSVYDIDGDGLDDIIAWSSHGIVGAAPGELHIYLASSFMAGPWDYPTQP